MSVISARWSFVFLVMVSAEGEYTGYSDLRCSGGDRSKARHISLAEASTSSVAETQGFFRCSHRAQGVLQFLLPPSSRSLLSFSPLSRSPSND